MKNASYDNYEGENMLKNNARFAIGVALSAVLAVSAGPALAQDYGLGQAYAGGGLTFTDFGQGNNDTLHEDFGFQGLGGYNFGSILPAESLDVMAEGGFWWSDTSQGNNNNVTGIWVNGVIAHRINQNWSALGRIGMDFDDDDGIMYGAGAEYHLPDVLHGVRFRGEMVNRDVSSSVQFTAIFHFPAM